MLFQEPIPNTVNYMIAGYIVTFVVLSVYVASRYLRNRNLKQDIAMLAELEAAASVEEKPKKKTAKPVTKKSKKK